MLDIFCCGGGAARGYVAAGWNVVGVDNDPAHLRNYPYPSICLDFMDLPLWFIRLFDAAHASPPCQGLTDLNNDKSRHLNLIPETRQLLQASGLPYIIENVRRARAHLIKPVSLFGTMFDCHMVTSTGTRFDLSRERLFETNWGLEAPEDPGAQGRPICNVFGGHLRCRSGEYRTGNGTGKTVDFPGEDRPALAAQAMGLSGAGLTMHQISEAVPPAFCQYIGGALLAHLRGEAHVHA